MKIDSRMTRLFVLTTAVALSSALAGCAHFQSDSSNGGLIATMSQTQQQAMSPDQALARLTEGNNRFVAGKSLHRNYTAQRTATAAAQHPFAVVHSCIDSRSVPEVIFDQGIGDIFAPRLAGNYATVDVIGGMEFATKVAGARLIVVVGHTECGAVMGACDNVELGNLTKVIQAIRPAVESVKNVSGDRNSTNAKFVLAATELNVHMTVANIRNDSTILREMEQSGQIKIVGAMYDLATGKVRFLSEAPTAGR